MGAMPKTDPFLIGPVIFSYVDSLYVPRSVNNGPERYSCNILFDDSVRQQLEAYIEPLGLQAFPDEWSVPNRCHRPIRSLAERPQYQEQLNILPPGIAYFASIGAGQYAPRVVGPDQKNIPDMIDPVTGRKPMYGGCVGYVQINAYSYRHQQGGPGVSLGVNTVIKLAEGNPLIEGGGVNIEKLFESIPAQMPVGFGLPPGQQPMQPQQPMQQPMQQPVQQPMQQPMQQGGNQMQGGQVGNPVQGGHMPAQPPQQPVQGQQPMQQPVQQPMQQPVQQPMQQPVQQPMQQPVQQPMQQPMQQQAPLQQGQQFQQAQVPPTGQQQDQPAAVHPLTGQGIPLVGNQ